MGRTARPRRTSQAWDRDQLGRRFQVHDSAPEAAIADLADIPSEACGLRNHVGCLASADLFVVPTANFGLLFVFIVLHHERRRVVHFGVTAHPTSLRVSRQIREAFPWETAPRHLIRDRDGSYGALFRSRLQVMGINEFLTAPRSPWQNASSERSGVNAWTTLLS